MSSLKNLIEKSGLSPCAKDYLECMADPIGAEQGCMPVNLVCIPTKKAKVRCTGTFAASSVSGVGFVLVRPALMAVNEVQSASNGAVAFTDSSYTGAVFDNNGAITGVSLAVSNSEYALADFSATGLQYRLVSCELEVENTTPWADRGGSITGVCTQDHQSLDALTQAQTLEFDAAWNEGVASGGAAKFSVKYNGPTDPGDLAFNSSFTTGNSTINDCMGIIISGNAQAQYIFRVVAHFEYIGTSARGKTSNLPDVQGSAIVNTVLASAAKESGRQNHNSRHWWDSLKSGLDKAIKYTGYLPGIQAAKLGMKYALPAYNALGDPKNAKQLAYVNKQAQDLTKNARAKRAIKAKSTRKAISYK